MTKILKFEEEQLEFDIPEQSPRLFKVEAENGLIDVYQEMPHGGLRVTLGDINVTCILKAWDVADLEGIPTLTEYVAGKHNQMTLFKGVANG